MDLASGAIPPRRLLIVGDPALSRGLMKMVLSRLGYVVTCVVTGQDCVMTVAHSQFALALIALSLPDMAGLTLARRLRGAPSPLGSMPIIMFGDAWDGERIRASCREAGLAAYLPKPISIARLVSSIHDHLHRPPVPSGVPVPMPQPVPLELERLTSFTEGDVQLERELTTLFLSTAAVYLDEMRACLTAGGGWSRPAHALKGAVSNFAAPAATDAALRLQQMGEKQDLAGAEAAVDELARELRAVRRALARLSRGT
jgi:CheY-like chemotaxis protein